MIKNQKGNVFIYILVAVGLFGALMFALSKSANYEDSTGDLSEGQSKVAANEIIAYAASARNALSQMEQTGATIDIIDFTLPSDATFNTAPTIHKLFHPDGGGLNYKSLPARSSADDGAGLKAGYYIGRFNNIEWTPSTTNDVVFVAYEIKKPVCVELNKRVTGSATIPTISGQSLDNLFVDDSLHGGSNADFQASNCAACKEIPALCVTDGADKYAFYSILDAE